MNFFLHNFVTGQDDPCDTFPTTDEQIVQYLPQWEETLELYDLYRKMGKQPQEAYQMVMEHLLKAHLK